MILGMLICTSDKNSQQDIATNEYQV